MIPSFVLKAMAESSLVSPCDVEKMPLCSLEWAHRTHMVNGHPTPMRFRYVVNIPGYAASATCAQCSEWTKEEILNSYTSPLPAFPIIDQWVPGSSIEKCDPRTHPRYKSYRTFLVNRMRDMRPGLLSAPAFRNRIWVECVDRDAASRVQRECDRIPFPVSENHCNFTGLAFFCFVGKDENPVMYACDTRDPCFGTWWLCCE